MAEPVEIKDVMVKLGGGILFILLSGFLIETILDIDIVNQCRLHYDEGVGSVTSVFGLTVEGERIFLECIQYSESIFVKTEKDAKGQDKVIERTTTVTNTCSGNSDGLCTTVVKTFFWTEKEGETGKTPGPFCKDGEYGIAECGDKKRYHAQDKPIPTMIFGLNAFILIVGMITFLMGGYKLVLYVKQAPK